MLSGSFAGKGTVALQKIDGTMIKEDCLEILKQHLKTSARMLKLGCNCVFQQDRYPKHTSRFVSDGPPESHRKAVDRTENVRLTKEVHDLTEICQGENLAQSSIVKSL